MAARIRKCATHKCTPGETIPLIVEGFQTDPERNCVADWAIIGRSNPFGTVQLAPSANGEQATFEADQPGCYTVRVRCCCRGANAEA